MELDIDEMAIFVLVLIMLAVASFFVGVEISNSCHEIRGLM